MKRGIFILTAFLLAACTTPDVAPIPGSITYGGQPATKLTKSPIGSKFRHTFIDDRGDRWRETYEILPDRSLKIINRERIRGIFRSDR